jgi:hypothetical protein
MSFRNYDSINSMKTSSSSLSIKKIEVSQILFNFSYLPLGEFQGITVYVLDTGHDIFILKEG